MKNYKLSKGAEIDLLNIWNYTVSQWSVAQAEMYTRELETQIEVLSSKPLLGRKLEYFPEVKKFSFKSHFIIYELRDSYIFVARILHQQMDLPKHLNLK